MGRSFMAEISSREIVNSNKNILWETSMLDFSLNSKVMFPKIDLVYSNISLISSDISIKFS